ncbi:MAG TPA: sialidase family protein [Actinomycetota bacterium]|nr:sialidase family protein [Actinomycetota bacterium]
MSRRFLVVALSAAVTVVASGAANASDALRDRHVLTFDSEHIWNTTANDWEPTVAADPGTSFVYQMTTRYGGTHVCGSGMQHCIFFRASADGGTTWGPDSQMCPGTSCKRVQAQNDPEMKVSASGVIYAAWMNDYDVVFAKSSDHGATWSTPIDFKKASGLSFTDKPILIISADGHDVYVAFNSSDSYVVASHDSGATFGPAVKTNSDGLYWFAEAGAVAPNGAAYFSESAENQTPVGPVKLYVLKSTNGGTSWASTLVDTSQQQPPCTVKNCPADFFGSQIAVAVDRAGTLMVAYSANDAVQAPLHLFARTSTDGVTWSARADIDPSGTAAGAGFPEIAAGPTAGDFRVAFQDDRNGATSWNTWFRRTTNGGGSWNPAVRLSDLGGGAPYKNPNGYSFPYGDYFGLSVGGTGTNYVIWGKGPNYDGPGGAWFTRGS